VALDVTGSTVPVQLQRIEAELEVAGRTITRNIACPCTPNQRITLEWDGLDAFGRATQGPQKAFVALYYHYPNTTLTRTGPLIDDRGPTFGAISGEDAVGVALGRSAGNLTLARRRDVDLGSFSNEVVGLGGQSVDAVHSYAVVGQTLYRGDGTRRRTDEVLAELDLVVVNPFGTSWTDLTVGADGAVWLVANGTLVRRSPEGVTEIVGAQLGQPCSTSDGTPAASACLTRDLGELTFGPDGSLFGVQPQNSPSRVVRIDPSRRVSVVAGTGVGGNSGDGGPATSAQITAFVMTVGPDGSVYVADTSRIRRVGTDGIIRTILGGPIAGFSGDGGPASAARIFQPTSLTASADGTVYVYHYTGATGVIRRIRPTSGIVECYAGCGTSNHFLTEGLPASSVSGLDRVSQLHFGRDGSLYFSESNGFLVRRFTPDDRLVTVAGLATCTPLGFLSQQPCGLGGPALASRLASVRLAPSPDGDLYGFMPGFWLFRIRPDLPSHGIATFSVAERDGRTLHRFDAAGRHRETVDADTNVVVTTVGYDAAGLLAEIVDEHGLVTSIERAPDGTPLAIVAPFGQRTELGLDANGWLSTVSDPAGSPWSATYTPDGLMTSWSNRNGDTKLLTWDDAGRLTSLSDAAGATKTLSAVTTDAGREVTIETPLGRPTTYGWSVDAGVENRTLLSPSGLQTTQTRTGLDVSVRLAPDGTTTETTRSPDPRFGLEATYPSRVVTRLPSGLTRTVTRSRAVTLANPDDPLSLLAKSETTTVGGRTWTSAWDATTRTRTLTSPEGRTRSTVLDELGRPVAIQAPEVLPLTLSYDSAGRLLTTTQGSRVSTRSYAADGWLASASDPLGQTTHLTRDLVGRVTAETRPDLSETAYAFDAEGRMVGLTPPGQPPHAMSYTPVDLLAAYTPPDLGLGSVATAYTYDPDRKLETVLQPGPRAIGLTYDDAGRLLTTTHPDGTITRAYHPTSGRLTSLQGPDPLTLTYSYDGPLMTSLTYQGAVHATLAWTYDTAFRLASETVQGQPHTITYDDDDLPVAVDALTMERDSAGRVTTATSGNVIETWTYDPFGSVASFTSTVSGTPSLAFTYQRDDLGRITEKTETRAGLTTVTAFTYDAVGRLLTVVEDGELVESFAYDANGNRVSSLNADGVFAATFDAQDRLATYGDLAFAFSLHGDLESRLDLATGDETTYAYDALGNLRSAVLPHGDALTYLVDGEGRRIAKLRNGATERQWVWRSRLQIAAELDAAGSLRARFIYGGRSNVPDLMVTATGATYRLVKDHLGSVRQVVDVSSGAVLQELAYDAWGRVLVDTNPGFQPFGFAGGLYDADTGLVRFGARDYDPETGRWTTKDPVRFEGGLNLYEYGASDPVNRVDATGRNPAWVLPALWTLGGGGGAAAAAGAAVVGGAGIAAGVLAIVWPNTVGDYDCDDGSCGPPPSMPLDDVDDDSSQSSPYRDAPPRFPEIEACASLGPVKGRLCCRQVCKFFDDETEPACAETPSYNLDCFLACEDLVSAL
jgi:RHS repeat-associated protein